MEIFLTILGVAFAVTFVLGIINKDDNVDTSYLEDC